MSLNNILSQVFGVQGGQIQGGAFGLPGNVPRVFKAKYHAYSPAYWNSENRDKLEKGDKIVLPASALEKLSRMQIQFPIMFEIAHDSDILPKKSHCSVLEFTAPEGSVYLPLWMIDNLGLDATGDSIIELTTVNLPKGEFVQFQAHETKFAMLSNPRIVLEKALRSYSCLTVGDTIQVEFNDYVYKLDVTEVKPSIQRGTAPPAISIIETDIKVDFLEPRDLKQWEEQQKLKNYGTDNYTWNHDNGTLSPNNSKPNSSKNNNLNSSKNYNNNSKNNNSSMNSNFDNKEDDYNNDGLFDNNNDGFMIQNWSEHNKKEKKSYFNNLEAIGSQAMKLKDKKNKKNKRNSGKLSNNTLKSVGNNNYNNNNKNDNTFGGRGAPLGMKSGKSNRGAPLGVNNNSPMMMLNKQNISSGGFSLNGGISGVVNNNNNNKNNKVTKEEEVIGNMRYIYEIDSLGNRTLIRRLPLRKLPMDTAKGHSLK